MHLGRIRARNQVSKSGGQSAPVFCGYVAEGFLSANGVDSERAESEEEMTTADITEKAERFAVLVGCWQ